MTKVDFGSSYQVNFRATVNFLLSKGAPQDHAEELAQSAWSKGWEHLTKLRNEDRLKTWVNTIAFNLFRRAIREGKRREPLPEMADGRRVDNAAIDLSNLLKLCGPADRRLLLYQMKGLTTSEMANQVGASNAAVRVRLTRARQSA